MSKTTKNDNYETPHWCVEWLLDEVELPGGKWLEPAAGSGGIIRAVNEHRSDVAWTAVEKREECERFLMGLVEPGSLYRDFLQESCPARQRRFDVVISNPPFSEAEQFVLASLPLADKVVMLARLDWLGSLREKRPWLVDHQPDVYVLGKRPWFILDGREMKKPDLSNYGWLVWPGDKKRTEARLKILLRWKWDSIPPTPGEAVDLSVVRELAAGSDPGPGPDRVRRDGTEYFHYRRDAFCLDKRMWGKKKLPKNGVLVLRIAREGERGLSYAFTEIELARWFAEARRTRVWQDEGCYTFAEPPPAARAFLVYV